MKMKAAITIMVMGSTSQPPLVIRRQVQVVFNLGGDNGSSKVVFNRVEEDQSILGSGAFMQPVSSTETMVGYFASTEQAGFDIDWGARWDSVKRQDPSWSTTMKKRKKSTMIMMITSLRPWELF